MTTTTIDAPLEELFRWELPLEEEALTTRIPETGDEAGVTEDPYVAPEALADEVEELQERVIWFTVAIWVLLALGATIVIGAYVYCRRKGLRFYAVVRSSPLKAKVGCKRK
jgi:hypothetical protein